MAAYVEKEQAVVLSNCKPRFMPYNCRHHIFARGAIGEKAKEIQEEFARMHPYPPDDFIDKLGAVSSDSRVQCPIWMEETLDLYNSQLNGNKKWQQRGPVYRMNALLSLPLLLFISSFF